MVDGGPVGNQKKIVLKIVLKKISFCFLFASIDFGPHSYCKNLVLMFSHPKNPVSHRYTKLLVGLVGETQKQVLCPKN